MKAELVALSPIQFTSDLGRYLGFPLVRGRVKNADFNFLLEKINSRLSSWKSKLLNKAGRVALANSVLTSIPVHVMQTMWVPAGICDALDSKVCSFISRALHLVNWQKIACPRQFGGLGLRDTRSSNVSLLGKLVWHMLHQPGKLWVDVLYHKYLRNGSLFSCAAKQGDSYT